MSSPPLMYATNRVGWVEPSMFGPLSPSPPPLASTVDDPPPQAPATIASASHSPGIRRCCAFTSVSCRVLADVGVDPGDSAVDPAAHDLHLLVEAGARRQLVVEELDVLDRPAGKVLVDAVSDGRQVALDVR